MSLPKNNKEILVLRQGTATPTYDENSRQVMKCLWEEVEHLKCVDHMPTSRGAESDATTTHTLETSVQMETFYFSLHNQLHTCDFDIKHGYYILQRISTRCGLYDCPEDAGYIFWKVVACRTYEILPGCWDIKMTGERLAGRESEQLILECAPYIKQLQGVITRDHD